MIGRREELAELRSRLDGRQRLVTLTGPGGIGKSRLAAEARSQLERGLPGGAWMVELGDLAEPGLLAAVVARAIGLPVQDDLGGADHLAEALEDRPALLVLDGCDQVLEPCARLARSLLERCPGLRVLATSRQPLGVTGESVVQVGRLPFPDPDRLPPANVIAASEAVELFVDRATAVVPGFRLADDNAESIARLCAALGGVPLALELAAARMTVLSPQALLERMDQRYGVLTKGAAGAPRRLRSLRASVEVSYDLCTDAERQLWQRMTVFTGTFELGAVEAVCSGDGIDEVEVLDLVDSLLEKSVLVREDADLSEVRYRLLESLRTFGAERLGPDAARWRHRHLAWCRQLLAETADRWFGAEQPALLRRLRLEDANIGAALELATTADPAAVPVMVAAAEPLWLTSDRVGEARHWLARLHRAEATAPEVRCRAALVAAWLAAVQGDGAVAVALLEDAGAVSASPLLRGRATWPLVAGAAALVEGRYAEAHRALAAGVHQGRLDGDELACATGELLQGLARLLGGDHEAAAASLHSCLELTEPVGELHLRSQALGLLGLTALGRGDARAAGEAAGEALRLQASLGARGTVALLLEVLAGVAAADADAGRAATLLGAAESLGRGAAPGWLPLLAEERERVSSAVRRALGERFFRARSRAGASMSADEAVRFGLGEASAEVTADAVDGSRLPSGSPLTARELEVAGLVARGRSNREIAATLHISPRTAQGHVENILHKLGFGSRAQVAAWVVERGGSAQR
jgi:predicted ATPase/DNA-binding CsgD family transcriptional regulator